MALGKIEEAGSWGNQWEAVSCLQGGEGLMSKEEGARFEGAQCLMELGDQIEGGQQSEVWGWGIKLGCRVEGCRDENR